jgi:hypothetical protein
MSIVKFHQLSDFHSNDLYTKNHRSSKKISLKSRPMGNVFNPYDGEVASLISNDCQNGFLRIAHKIGDKIYYSEFCNIPRIKVGRGDVIKKGKVIGGYLNDTDEIDYKLKIKGNSGFEKISPFEFFTGINIDSKEPMDKDKSSDFNPSNNKRNKKDNDDDDDNTPYSSPKSSDIKGSSLLLGLSLSPLDYISRKVTKAGEHIVKTTEKSFKDIGKFKDKKSEKKKEEEKQEKDDDKKKEVNERRLTEEIKRIKKLL